MKEESTVEAYKHLLITLMRKDVVVVTASGNSRVSYYCSLSL